MQRLFSLLVLISFSSPLWAEQAADLDAQLKAARLELEQSKKNRIEHTDGRVWLVPSFTDFEGAIIFKDTEGKFQNFRKSEVMVTIPNPATVLAADKKVTELTKSKLGKEKIVDLDAANIDKLNYADRQAKINAIMNEKAPSEFIAYMSKLGFETVEEAWLFVMRAIPAPRGMDLQIQMRQDTKLDVAFRREFLHGINMGDSTDAAWYWNAAVTHFGIRPSEIKDLMKYVPPENAITAETSVQAVKRKAFRERLLKEQERAAKPNAGQ